MEMESLSILLNTLVETNRPMKECPEAPIKINSSISGPPHAPESACGACAQSEGGIGGPIGFGAAYRPFKPADRGRCRQAHANAWSGMRPHYIRRQTDRNFY